MDSFFQERPLFLRQRASGMYRTTAYVIAKTLGDVIPMRVFPPLIMGKLDCSRLMEMALKCCEQEYLCTTWLDYDKALSF